MGFQHAAVLAPVSFFLGVLFICLNVDHRVIWSPLNDEIINDAFQFYTTFFNAPKAIHGLLHGMMAVGMTAILFKLLSWTEIAKLFDGTSTAAYVFAIAIYLSVIIPSLQIIATPVETDTRESQIEALRVLSAGNIIIIGLMALILVMQAGQEIARRSEAKALKKFQAELAAEEAEKKKQ